MRKPNKAREDLLHELRDQYEHGASIRKLVASTGRSYGSIHSMLRESGTTHAQPRRPEPHPQSSRLTPARPLPVPH